MKSGHDCTAQCKEGYRPSTDLLSCQHGEFFPAEFVCHEAPCAVPVGVQHSNNSFPCSELWSPLTSSSIPSGKVCSPQCTKGFSPDIEALNCSLGTLSPPVFECVETPCLAPVNVTHGANVVCKEGHSIGHDFSCTPQCTDGYEPSVASLTCEHGEFSPNNFKCVPASCKAPSVDHAPSVSCAERVTGHIPHEESCVPVCEEGWKPSEPFLTCFQGKLEPQTFSCVESACAAPENVEHGLGCKSDKGSSIAHGTSCSPACAEGYEPSVDTLVCIRGGLEPATYSCIPKPCNLPTDIEHVGSSLCDGSSSDKPGMLSAGSTCTPTCARGFFASEPELSCNAGELTPPTFECGPPKSCKADSASLFIHTKGTHPVSPCWEGDEIDHGKDCHVQCGDGYTSTVKILRCENGRLKPSTPEEVECKPNHELGDKARCLAPVGIAHQQYIPCNFDKVSFEVGEECVVRCADEFTPSLTKLTCHEDGFEPPTFECHHQH